MGWFIAGVEFGEAGDGILLLETLIDFCCNGARYGVRDKDDPLFWFKFLFSFEFSDSEAAVVERIEVSLEIFY